jgi:hypothetical protein
MTRRFSLEAALRLLVLLLAALTVVWTCSCGADVAASSSDAGPRRSPEASLLADASELAEASSLVDSPAPLRDAPAAFAVDRWMEDASAIIGHQPLSRLLLPGTHDSATYALLPTSSRPPSDPFAPDAVDVLVRLGSLTNVTAAWSQTQDKSIGAQLQDGVRTLDFRVCLDKSDTFRLCHGLYGPALHEVLQDVRDFAVTHPKEIVILFIDGFTDWTPTAADAGPAYGNMSAANIDRVKVALEQELGDVLLDHSAVSPESTVDAIWAGQPQRTLAVVFERNPAAPFWGTDRLTKSWQDTWHEDDKKASLVSALAADAQRCTQCGTIFEFSGEVTEDATLIELSFLSSRFPASLRDLADVANPVILGWVRDAWTPLGYRMNAVQVDFYDRSCLVPLVLSLNGIDALPTSGCSIGTGTAWGSYWNEALGATCIPDDQCHSKHCAGVCVACKANSDCGAGHLCVGAACL